MRDWLLELDGAILLWIQEHLRIGFLNDVLCGYTFLGNAGILFLVLAAVLLCFKKTRKAGGAALGAISLGFVCTNLVVKHLVSRPRPWLDVAGLAVLITENDPNSFPSGHATCAFAFAGALLYAAPERWMKWAAWIVAVLMGFSRVYVGVHYLSDVLAGALIGLLAGWAAWQGVKQIKR